MSDASAPDPAADPPASPSLAAALEKAEKYKQKLHGAVKKGKSIESERDALREQLDAAVRELATANTKLKVMREMEAVSVEAAAAAADEPSVAAQRAAALEADLAETRAELEASEEALRRAEAEKDALSDALDESRATLEHSKRGEAGAIVAAARAEDAENRAADLAADLAAQRVARAAAEEAAAAARAAMEEAHRELASLGDGARAERASAETTRRDADAERRAAAEARDNAEASAAESETRAARAEARAAELEAELEAVSEAAETRRARFEHVQALHAEREAALRRELAEGAQSLSGGTQERRSRSGGAAEAAAEAEALEAENARLRAALETFETAEAAAPFAGDEHLDGARDRALDALRRRVAVAEAAAVMAREETSESLRATAALKEKLAEERREAAARAERTEASSARDRRGYETAMEENARLRRVAVEGGGGGGGEGATREPPRAVAAAEAKAARLQATVASLEAENASLQWQVAANVGGKGTTPSFPWRAAETGAETKNDQTIKNGDLSPPLFERVLRDKSHRRAVVIGYLAVLHLLVYFSTAHGTFSHGARVRCVSGTAP